MPISITSKGAANVRKCIAYLQVVNPATLPELSDILRFTRGGTLRYVRILESVGLVKVSIQQNHLNAKSRIMVVELIACGERISQYLRNVDERMATPEQLERAMSKRKEKLEVGTMVHQLLDDLGMSRVRNADVKIRRDPMDIFLFGSGRAPSLATDDEVPA